MAVFFAPRNLEPQASVTEAVLSLTITDPFVAVGESAAPPPSPSGPSEVHLLLHQLQCRLQQGLEARRAPTRVLGAGGGEETLFVTIKKAGCRRIDAFELWCWRRLWRVPWTERRSNQSILKEISSPGCSLEGLMLKLKLQYFGHLMLAEEPTHLKRP